jgi:hypothetical protein
MREIRFPWAVAAQHASSYDKIGENHNGYGSHLAPRNASMVAISLREMPFDSLASIGEISPNGANRPRVQRRNS